MAMGGNHEITANTTMGEERGVDRNACLANMRFGFIF